MNRKMIFSILRKLMLAEGLLLLIPMGVAIIYREPTWWCFLAVTALLAAVGLWPMKEPANQDIYAKEGFVIVGLAWLLWSVFGALPFVISGCIPNMIDAVFETASGFTTTGSTILTEIESLPRGILFWRSFTHFIGGMGVLVFVLAIVPLAGSRSMYIMRAEVPGPTVDKLVPKTGQTAKILYGMYIALTAVLVIMLCAGGMPLYDSLVTAFGTAGTGGFAVKNISIAAYNSAYTDIVLSVFMTLFSFNFNLYYLVLTKRLKSALKSEELWAFLGIIAASVLSIAFNIRNLYSSFGEALRYSGFQVTSIISTTGFSTADFAQWPQYSQNLLLLLMFIGACAGSTGGGLKVGRVVLMCKSIRRELGRIARPRIVAVIRMDGKVVEEETIKGVHNYIVIYVAILFVSCLIVAMNGVSVETALSSVAACLNNIGPGLGPIVGPMGNFASLSYLSKIVLTADMLIGRLEIFPILMIMMPSLWRKKAL